MTVEQLIEELKKHGPNKIVVVAGYEGGHDEVDSVSEIRLILNANTEWWYGKHEQDDAGECHAISIG